MCHISDSEQVIRQATISLNHSLGTLLKAAESIDHPLSADAYVLVVMKDLAEKIADKVSRVTLTKVPAKAALPKAGKVAVKAPPKKVAKKKVTKHR